jgi:hypothetical protein
MGSLVLDRAVALPRPIALFVANEQLGVAASVVGWLQACKDLVDRSVLSHSWKLLGRRWNTAIVWRRHIHICSWPSMMHLKHKK